MWEAVLKRSPHIEAIKKVAQMSMFRGAFAGTECNGASRDAATPCRYCWDDASQSSWETMLRQANGAWAYSAKCRAR